MLSRQPDSVMRWGIWLRRPAPHYSIGIDLSHTIRNGVNNFRKEGPGSMNPEDQDRTKQRTQDEPENRPDGGQEASNADSGSELEEAIFVE